MKTKIDHLVIGAATLEQGAAFVRDTLGVDIPSGGAHPQMGTHNLLMRLSESTFFEVIAINPDIPAPSRPRWFGLDDPAVRRSISQSPALLTWVANTTDIDKCLAVAPVELGLPETIRRDHLSWSFGLPDDGKLFADGLLPCLIQWYSSPHPAGAMADLGCRLTRLNLYHHDPAWLATIFAAIGLVNQPELIALAEQQPPFLEAVLETPAGTRTLRSPVD